MGDPTLEPVFGKSAGQCDLPQNDGERSPRPSGGGNPAGRQLLHVDVTRVPAESTVTIGYIPTSHLDLFWLGNYKSCLARGVEVIRQYVDRCLETEDETFLLETAVFAEEFLRRYPEYRQRLVGLVKDGRVEVGAAYIDRWEHRPLGESHIRNLVLGKRWYQEVFGQDNKLATHPDLPSFVPQTPQIYARAGVKYYATTRGSSSRMEPSGDFGRRTGVLSPCSTTPFTTRTYPWTRMRSRAPGLTTRCSTS